VENGSILHYVVSLEGREINDRSFEDRKQMVAELKSFFFLIFFLLLARCFSSMFSLYLGCAF
jgi:hypothetical protein